MKMKKILSAVLLVSLLFVVGCGNNNNEGPSRTDRDTVQIVYVEWVCATASAHVIANVLEEKMGYDVELIPVAAALVFESLAHGHADFTTNVWLPVTHADYMERLGDRLDLVQVNTHGARIGLAVPDYVQVYSIADLNTIRDELGGEIIGIDPGAGIMRITEEAINAYNLDLLLLESSDAAMTAFLSAAIDRQDPVVITGWEPHWKFSTWNMRFLDDPLGIFGGEEEIATVARVGLSEDMPGVYELLQNFRWSIDQLNEAILMAEESGNSARSAADWVANNSDLVNSWLPAAYR
ncbi:MAG: glycine betaine ABC transporter substrate-binding protein [Clostridiales bacterium]|nr:glycine betaine ABC transporter substrate-binding protein [Clostridiales bacterium]